MMIHPKHTHVILGILGVAVVIGLSVWTVRSHPVVRSDVSTVQIGNRSPIPVAIADTPEARTQGLSGTDHVPEGGMLFVFPQVGKYGFWMKDMKYALDILWIDESGKIIDITDDFTPASYPEIYTPKSDILYALEVPADFTEVHKIEIGEQVTLDIKK